MADSEGMVPYEAEFLLYQTEDGRLPVTVRAPYKVSHQVGILAPGRTLIGRCRVHAR